MSEWLCPRGRAGPIRSDGVPLPYDFAAQTLLQFPPLWRAQDAGK
jgi:hypothetical protein